MSATERKLAYIATKDVLPNPAALRQVNKTGEKYLELVGSVRNQGILKPILVHETINPETKEPCYGLSDGLHRFNAAQDCGLDTIPAHIVPLDESEVLITQIMANVHTIETKPAEYADALVRLMGEKPTMTLSELAAKLDKSPTWLDARLSLTNLKEDIKKLVDEGKINLTNAYALAKLDEEFQGDFLERAQTEIPDVFVPTVTNRIKELKEAKRAGQKAAAETFTAVAHPRKLSELKDEHDKGTFANVYATNGVIQDAASFKAGIAFALNLDPLAVDAARAKWEAKKKDRDEKKAKADAAKTEKQVEDAKKTLAALGMTVIPSSPSEPTPAA